MNDNEWFSTIEDLTPEQRERLGRMISGMNSLDEVKGPVGPEPAKKQNNDARNWMIGIGAIILVAAVLAGVLYAVASSSSHESPGSPYSPGVPTSTWKWCVDHNSTPKSVVACENAG